jgi:hypothetical protein
VSLPERCRRSRTTEEIREMRGKELEEEAKEEEMRRKRVTRRRLKQRVEWSARRK